MSGSSGPLYRAGDHKPSHAPTFTEARKLIHALDHAHIYAAMARQMAEGSQRAAYHDGNAHAAGRMSEYGQDCAEKAAAAIESALRILGAAPPPDDALTDTCCAECASGIAPGRPHLRHPKCSHCCEPIAPDDVSFRDAENNKPLCESCVEPVYEDEDDEDAEADAEADDDRDKEATRDA